jgi:hypothetical protein
MMAFIVTIVVLPAIIGFISIYNINKKSNEQNN